MGQVGGPEIEEHAREIAAPTLRTGGLTSADLESLESQVRVRADSIANSPVQEVSARENRRRNIHIAVAAAAFVLVPFAGGGSDAALGLICTMMFVCWPWMTVVIVQASNRKDKARISARTQSALLVAAGMRAIAESAEAHQLRELRERDSAAAQAAGERAAAEDRVLQERIHRGTPPPDPQPFGVSHEGAEALVAHWMRHLGEYDAEVTRFVGDGGIDVAGSRFIAQVKNYAGSVGVAEVRELAGVASVDGRRPLFFTSGSYGPGAIEFAARAGVALFKYDAVHGSLSGVNEQALGALAGDLNTAETGADGSDSAQAPGEADSGREEVVQLYRPLYRLEYLVIQTASWVDALMKWGGEQKSAMQTLEASGESSYLGYSYEHFLENLAWVNIVASEHALPLAKDVAAAYSEALAELGEEFGTADYFERVDEKTSKFEAKAADCVRMIDGRNAGVRESAQTAFLDACGSRPSRRDLLLLGFDLETLPRP